MLLPINEYLGDSVYVEFDGYNYTLTTNNGLGPSNKIVLDPNVFNILIEFKLKIENMID